MIHRKKKVQESNVGWNRAELADPDKRAQIREALHDQMLPAMEKLEDQLSKDEEDYNAAIMNEYYKTTATIDMSEIQSEPSTSNEGDGKGGLPQPAELNAVFRTALEPISDKWIQNSTGHRADNS